MPVTIYRPTRRNISEDFEIRQHSCEKLKSRADKTCIVKRKTFAEPAFLPQGDKTERYPDKFKSYSLTLCIPLYYIMDKININNS
jgi:hypothetical protein